MKRSSYLHSLPFCLCWCFLFAPCWTLTAQDFPLIDDDEGLVAAPAENPELAFLSDGSGPTTIEQLRLMEEMFAEVAEIVAPATVNIAVEEAQGSGVIVSRDGYILTAAHVINRPNQPATITFADGSRADAITLGVNRPLDSGMLKITDPGKWPFVDIGESESLGKGQWVMAIGHPGGLTEGRGLVYRAGRLLKTSDRVLTTDCTLVGGDSGGPLVDLNGLVIGIHSRIGPKTYENYHVPIDAYSDEWDQLADGAIVGSSKALLGVDLVRDNGKTTNRVIRLYKYEAAEKAGMKVGDEIIKVNDVEVTDGRTLRMALAKLKPRDKVKVIVNRDGEEIELDVVLGYG